jgi:release factor H-coupled RctB family protein
LDKENILFIGGIGHMQYEKGHIFASERNWIEGDAIRQLKQTAELPGMVAAIGMPDLHPGKGCPVGAAFLTQGRIYPHLVGNDVGCGMALWKTNIKRQKIKRDKWAKKLVGLESPWEGDSDTWLSKYNIVSSAYDQALGTIGGGNHFAEIQVIEKIYEQDIFDRLKLNKNVVMLLVHSGSRGIGEALLWDHAAKYGARGLVLPSEEAEQYLEQHKYALKWAEANRALIAHRLAEQLRCECEKVLDVSHNSISQVEMDGQQLWLHRKGAAPSDGGPVVIPGTRGSLSYLVMPTGNQQANAWSVAHGAGRKWNRSSAKGRLQGKYTAKSLTQTEIGSYVICEDKGLLFEEAPQAYKKIDVVIDDMVSAGLIHVIVTLKPVITYKVRKRR